MNGWMWTDGQGQVGESMDGSDLMDNFLRLSDLPGYIKSLTNIRKTSTCYYFRPMGNAYCNYCRRCWHVSRSYDWNY